MPNRSAHSGPNQTELPLPASSFASVPMAALIAVLAWLAFVAQTDITIGRMLLRGLSVIDGIERLSSYLTNLTMLAVAISFSCVATRARFAPARC